MFPFWSNTMQRELLVPWSMLATYERRSVMLLLVLQVAIASSLTPACYHLFRLQAVCCQLSVSIKIRDVRVPQCFVRSQATGRVLGLVGPGLQGVKSTHSSPGSRASLSRVMYMHSNKQHDVWSCVRQMLKSPKSPRVVVNWSNKNGGFGFGCVTQ